MALLTICTDKYGRWPYTSVLLKFALTEGQNRDVFYKQKFAKLDLLACNLKSWTDFYKILKNYQKFSAFSTALRIEWKIYNLFSTFTNI